MIHEQEGASTYAADAPTEPLISLSEVLLIYLRHEVEDCT